MTYNFHVPLEKMMCHFFEKSPKFYKNYPQNQWFCVVCCSVKALLQIRSNVGVTNVSVGLVTNRGLVEQVPSHFTSFLSCWLNRLPVHSRLFSLDIVVTLVHTFPCRTRQPSQWLGA